MECEHLDGNIMGKCAICGDLVCGECFQSLFSVMICGSHEHLLDEGEWELVGFYTDQQALEERRYFLNEQEITSIVVETDDETLELHVPVEEKDDAFAALIGATDEVLHCDSCKVFYSPEIGTCPICGVHQSSTESSEG